MYFEEIPTLLTEAKIGHFIEWQVIDKNGKKKIKKKYNNIDLDTIESFEQILQFINSKGKSTDDSKIDIDDYLKKEKKTPEGKLDEYLINLDKYSSLRINIGEKNNTIGVKIYSPVVKDENEQGINQMAKFLRNGKATDTGLGTTLPNIALFFNKKLSEFKPMITNN